MKKLIVMAAFLIAFSGYAAAQTSEGTTASATTNSEKAFNKKDKVKKDKSKKTSKEDKKAAAEQAPQKTVKISVPVPDLNAKDVQPVTAKKEEQ